MTNGDVLLTDEIDAEGALGKDVRDLLTQVSDIVFEKSGIRLEPEVRIW